MYKKLSSIFIAAFLSCSFGLQAQIITTMAGTGTQGFSGDGGLAAYCEMGPPSSLAIDKVGNIFICDRINNRIRKIDQFGAISTIAGTGIGAMSGDGGPAVKAKMFNPAGIAVDGKGNLYIADSRNNRIRKVDSGGTITTIAGNGVAGFSGDDSSALNAKLNSPYGVAIDNNGNVYIADSYNNRIRKVTPAGIISTIAGKGSVGSFTGDGGPATAASLNQPQSLAIDNAGNIVVADTRNNRIRRINTAGIINTIAGNSFPGFGGDQGIPFVSQVNVPTGVVVDHKGGIYIADLSNNRIRKVDTNGVISTIAGTGLLGVRGDGGDAGDAQLYAPIAVTVDTADNLYVGQGNGTIRFIYQNGITEDSIAIFPNPCRDVAQIFLYSKYEELADIQILNSSGRLISTAVGPTNRFIKLPFDAAGFYIIYAVTKHNRWRGKVSSLHY